MIFGFVGIDHRVEAVAEDRHEPVAVANAVNVVGARGASLGRVVLRAAVNVVEGRVVVDRDFVELGDRQVLGVTVRLAAVPRLIKPAVAADDRCSESPGRSRAHDCRRVSNVLPAGETSCRHPPRPGEECPCA